MSAVIGEPEATSVDKVTTLAPRFFPSLLAFLIPRRLPLTLRRANATSRRKAPIRVLREIFLEKAVIGGVALFIDSALLPSQVGAGCLLDERENHAVYLGGLSATIIPSEVQLTAGSVSRMG
jgi:hypothetical protein